MLGARRGAIQTIASVRIHVISDCHYLRDLRCSSMLVMWLLLVVFAAAFFVIHGWISFILIAISVVWMAIIVRDSRFLERDQAIERQRKHNRFHQFAARRFARRKRGG